MKPKVTNVWSAVSEDGTVSRVVIESTVPPARWRLSHPIPGQVFLDISGLTLNLPAGALSVWDGLIEGFSLAETGADGDGDAADGAAAVRVQVALEHPGKGRVEVQPGLPTRTMLTFDRGFLRSILAGRVIAIDPGHGGEDRGALGPINLVEKHLTLDIARRLAAELERSGARPLLTRAVDEASSLRERLALAAGAGAEAFVSIHTGHTPRPEVRGTRTLYHTSTPGGPELARYLHRDLVRKIRMPDRGIAVGGRWPGGHQPGGRWPVEHWPGGADGSNGAGRTGEAGGPGPLPFPAVTVEAVCVGNPVEEGWLRSPVFKDRIARGLCNGLKDYFYAKGVTGR